MNTIQPEGHGLTMSFPLQARSLFPLKLLLIVLCLFLTSCQDKEMIDRAEQETHTQDNIEVQDGVLIFPNNAAFESFVDKQNKIAPEERRKWETEMGFISRKSLFEDIVAEEERLSDAYYGEYVDKGLSEDEIIALKLPKFPHSDLYLDAKAKNDIIIFEDSDTASTYALNASLVYAPVLSVNGFVMVGDTLSQYLRGMVKHVVGGTLEDRGLLSRATVTDVSRGILVASKENMSRESFSWATSPYDTKWEYSDNSKRRASYEVLGWASDYGILNPTSMYVENQLNTYAQRKRFGVWRARHSYRPYFAMWMYWDTKFGFTDGTNGCVENTSVVTNWPFRNPVPSSALSVISRTITAGADQWDITRMWPYGTFTPAPNTGLYFCELYRTTYLDMNVIAHGDNGGTMELGTYKFIE